MANPEKARSAPLVLIANDQEWSARSLESILGPSGYSVVRAYTGQQALERARTAQPDLIILDAQMPDVHGFEVCRLLRSDPRFSATTPIIITTSGPSGRTQRLEAYRAGAWEFLGQPLDGEALLLKLATFLQCKLEVDSLGMRACWIRVPGSTTCGACPAGRTRSARTRFAAGTRSPAWSFHPSPKATAAGESPDEEVQRIAEQVGQLFKRAGRASDAIGRLGHSEFAVIAPATDPAKARSA